MPLGVRRPFVGPSSRFEANPSAPHLPRGWIRINGGIGAPQRLELPLELGLGLIDGGGTTIGREWYRGCDGYFHRIILRNMPRWVTAKTVKTPFWQFWQFMG
jgi:hypothetical protein